MSRDMQELTNQFFYEEFETASIRVDVVISGM
jgi:hypothetical protein